MRSEIAAAIGHRKDVEQDLRSIIDAAPDHGADWSLLRFNHMLEGERDPRNVERIEQTKSDVAAMLATIQRTPASHANAARVAPTATRSLRCTEKSFQALSRGQ